MNVWYLNIYMLWMNGIFNIWIPIISLIVLNIIICRYYIHMTKMSMTNIPIEK